MVKSSKLIRPLFAIALVAMMSVAAFSGCIGKNDKVAPAWAEISEISADEVASLKSISSVMSNVPTGSVVVASDSDPLYALIATPIAAHYEAGALKSVPLLVSNSGNTYPWIHKTPAISTEPTVYTDVGPVARFLQTYNPSSSIMLGMDKISVKGTSSQSGTNSPVDYTLAATESYLGSPTEVALKLTEKYWTKADAAILVEQNDTKGYADALNVAPLASYLNIPIIPVGDVNETVAKVLSSLGVKYTLACGDVKIPVDIVKQMGKVMKFAADSDISSAVLSLLPKSGSADSSSIPYIVMANPLDTYTPVVLDQQVMGNITGSLTDAGSSVPYPGMPEAGEQLPFKFTVPADYNYVNLRMNFTFDLTGLPLESTPVNADLYNTRGLFWIYQVVNGTENLVFMGNSVCYDQMRDDSGKPTKVWVVAEVELTNQPGDYVLKIGPLVGASVFGALPGTATIAGTLT
ncbi:MAG: hypothetical protein PHH26_03040, partial [Candidatus Thermoplasmatota archaeon]|nr:hypothetical protein [Candidatus Thermoplasmatota archaeon]